MTHEQFIRERRDARYQGAWKFLDGGIFNRSNILTDGQTIYSYGYHFPMARKLDNGTIAVNVDRYSRTTSKHQSALRDVLRIMGYQPTGTMADIHDRYAFEVWAR